MKYEEFDKTHISGYHEICNLYDIYNEGLTDGKNMMLDSVRASLKDWPNAGIDKEIAEHVDRICKEYYKEREKKSG